jgi:hypothetical protein
MSKPQTLQLLRFDRTNILVATKLEPTISLSMSNVWRINKAAMAQMKLKEGQQVAVFQNPKEPRDWYIAVVPSNGFELRGKQANMEFNSKDLKLQLFTALEWEHPCGTMKMGTEPIQFDGLTLWPLITSSLTYRPRKTKV